MGNHHHPTTQPSRAKRLTLAVLAAAAGTVVWWATTPAAHDVTTAVTSTLASPAAEQIYLVELHEAGINLNPDEQAIAVQIAREHVAHGHLIGMREPIRGDFRERIPRLTPEQVEIAKVAVEHHFLAVTGRKQ